MLDASRDNDELALADDGFMVAEFHAQRAFDDEEELVFDVMVMPDEFTLELDGLHRAIIDFANYAGMAVVGEAAELFFEVDGFHFAPCLEILDDFAHSRKDAA